ncbi:MULTISPECIES: hypothetical protein [Mycobacteriaceae]|uniref:hypothetical protein n=1 Tax=Mycobacteriaceae TaxID=1762 RepID=UPI0007FE899C|nr:MULTISPECIES: hypothetical protein [Mycobacteriaceae]MCK0174930.1 hypothetical protein [Mycolicibacterium sp. F2034L]OBB61420.1 hypothetical protein A5757_07995 [Mycobacterium sp. 852013-51886_SCH5428379]
MVIEPGLSDAEFTHLEGMLGIEFADDHRAFLAAGLRVGASWPDWRGEGRRSLQKRLQLPAEGVLFDVEWTAFWLDGWGRRPARMKDALRSARYHLAAVPQMIPVFGNHYLPAGRGTVGRPVLSIVRTDVAVVGANLHDYVDRDCGSTGAHAPAAADAVEFWSTLAG